MKLCILVYEGVDIWDIVFPYDMFYNLNDVEVEIVSPSGGEVTLKDKSLVIGGTKAMSEVKDIDVLWTCQGEGSVDTYVKDEKFKIQLARLSDKAEKVVIIGSASLFFINIFPEQNKTSATHPYFKNQFTKLGGSYTDDVLIANGKFFTTSTRVSCLYLVLMIVYYYFGEQARDELFSYYNFDVDYLTKFNKLHDKSRHKELAKLCKQTLKLKSANELATNKLDYDKDSIVMFLTDDFNPLNFGAFYGVISNYQAYDFYLVGTENKNYYVNGGGFYIKTNFNSDNIEKFETLVICSNTVDLEKTPNKYDLLKISELGSKAQKLIALDGSEKAISSIKFFNKYKVDEEKILQFESTGQELNWINKHLAELTNDFQAELFKSEYFL